jgi:phenylalanyl-tRNA synthetase beta chain
VTVQAPSYRGDLVREIDLIEEVARLHGYDNIPVTLPRLAMDAKRPAKEARLREKAKELLLGMGFFEVINYAFQPERWPALLPGGGHREFVRLANPISEEQAVMRLDLLPGLLENMRRNSAHLNKDLKIFEIAKVFQPRTGDQLPRETMKLAGLMTGARNTPAWNLPADTLLDYYDLKGVMENMLAGLLVKEVSFQPAETNIYSNGTRVLSGEKQLGYLGELHPEIAERFELKQTAWVFQLDFVDLVDEAPEFAHFTALPKYPAVFRDLAVTLAATIPAAQVTEVIFACGRPWLIEAELFDVYAGPPVPAGERSLAFHLYYRDPERTLTDEEVNPWHHAIIQGLQEQLGAKLRA